MFRLWLDWRLNYKHRGWFDFDDWLHGPPF